jgi:hypothetical protein
MPALPSTESFLAEFGITQAGKHVSQPEKQTKEEVARAVARTGVSAEFAQLLTQYCATSIAAHELGQVDWRALAKRLGTQPEYLAEAAAQLNQDEVLWTAVLQERIKRASAAKVFRDASWERLESIAVNRLIAMAEKNMIRDPGELLAVASHARRANTDLRSGGGAGGTTVNINMNGDSMDSENGLPAAGAKMTIDLSPRVATALASKQAANGGQGRVIDGQMLSAAELRAALQAEKDGTDADSTKESENGSGIFAEDS